MKIAPLFFYTFKLLFPDLKNMKPHVSARGLIKNAAGFFGLLGAILLKTLATLT